MKDKTEAWYAARECLNHFFLLVDADWPLACFWFANQQYFFSWSHQHEKDLAIHA